MIEYVKLLILAYFKQFPNSYSFDDIMDRLGILPEILNEILKDLINSGYLKYINNLLKLTPQGRIKLINTTTEYYDYSIEKICIEKITSENAWPIDKPYVPKDFLRKL